MASLGSIRRSAPDLPVGRTIEFIHEELRQLRGGEPATYIPALADADPDWFGISLVMLDGQRYDAGDSAKTFTIQSISKPFVFGMALEDRGAEDMLARVGVEPTGDPFNHIAVEEETRRPFNPMVNAGAIVTTDLLGGDGRDGQFRRLCTGFAQLAGRELTVDEDVFTSERVTGDRNRAIAYFMRAFDMLPADVDAALDLYFRQCSLLVDCHDLAVMAATLANRGVNPVTSERALSEEHVVRVLSVMNTCGMYDFAGEWVYRVGMPAKSGVSGGIIAVVPGQLGIGIYSPPLDQRGNSVRGIAACESLSEHFNLHVLKPHSSAADVVRRVYTGASVRSKRRRTEREAAVLRAEGPGTVVLELQGDLYFASAEALSREVRSQLDVASVLILDCRRVGTVDEGAVAVLDDILGLAARMGSRRAFCGARRGTAVAEILSAQRAADPSLLEFADVDAALEWQEDQILHQHSAATSEPASDLAHHDLMAGLGDGAVMALERVTQIVKFEVGEVVFQEGDRTDSLYFVLEGRVGIYIHVAGQPRRLATMGPSAAFGEMALLDGGARSTSVRAEEATTCRLVSSEVLRTLSEDFPTLTATIYANIARSLSRRLRDANEEIRALD